MILIMAPVFLSMYIESLRKTVIKLGYPEDHQATSWRLRDFLIWLCYCVGNDEKKKDKDKGNH